MHRSGLSRSKNKCVCVQTGVDVAKLLSHKKKLEAKRLRKEKKAAKKAKKEAKKRAKEAAVQTTKVCV